MNYAKTLYDQLMVLANSPDLPFYFVDQEKDNTKYRIFSYRLASYTEFLLPGGLESRGTMFELDMNGNMVRLAALPMEKFWNLNENPATMGLNLDDVVLVEDKLDGSLISTFLHNGIVAFKSKASLHSEQATDSYKWAMENNPLFYMRLADATGRGWTVNLEWTAPWNRVVLGHQEPALTVLNARNIANGQYATRAELAQWFGESQLVRARVIDLNAITDMVGVEGFVLHFRSGQKVKVKTAWYLALHKAKDSVNSDRALFEVVVSEGHDDLRAQFPDDAYLQARIAEMEQKVVAIFADMKRWVDNWYAENKHLVRKDFAIKAQAEVPRIWFGPLMNLYVGKEVDVKDYIKRRYKDFGVSEDQKEE